MSASIKVLWARISELFSKTSIFLIKYLTTFNIQGLASFQMPHSKKEPQKTPQII